MEQIPCRSFIEEVGDSLTSLFVEGADEPFNFGQSLLIAAGLYGLGGAFARRRALSKPFTYSKISNLQFHVKLRKMYYHKQLIISKNRISSRFANKSILKSTSNKLVRLLF